jgi:predicted CXXCH cytochrome family protein
MPVSGMAGRTPLGRVVREGLTGLLVLGSILLPRTGLGGVQGTSHDMTRKTGEIFKGPCVYCHTPHQAKGERLWVTSGYGPSTGWGSRTVAQLCYTCHDNTGGGYGASDVTATAYSPSSHGFVVSSLPPLPDGTRSSLPPLPYTAGMFLDCTTCHDAHSHLPPFLRTETIDLLCIGCHSRSNAGLVGTRNSHGSPERPYSLHPTDMEYLDLPGNGATSLHPFPNRLQVPTAVGAWRLGAHRVGWQTGAGKIGCQTCHPVHGGYDYNSGILPGPPFPGLLPLENSLSPNWLCQSCHAGGDPGEEVGRGTDHPINTNDGDPVVVYPAGWPSGVNGEVTCTSCHDVHGGEPGSSLLRRGGNTQDGWCFTCHVIASLTPPYHHSCRENDEPGTFVSVISCGDCHGTQTGWTAHNGFTQFKVSPDPARSALCEACHDPADPLRLDAEAYRLATGRVIDFSAHVQPAYHGRRWGDSSHLVDEADDDSIANCQIRTTPWPASGAVSRYGSGNRIICESCHGVLANAGLLLGSGTEAMLTGGWKMNLLLETYEDNSPGVGIEVPDISPGPTGAALCRGCHYSVREGIPPTFVHNPMAHTVTGYAYQPQFTPYGRSTVLLLTTPNDPRAGGCPEVSTADQQGSPSGFNGGKVPGAFSYPANNVLDCDSCHRPHGADTDSADDGVRRILKFTSPGAHGTTPCAECHDTDVQCGFEISP